MELERKLTKKRWFFGYSVKETSMLIQSLQDDYTNEMNQLENAIMAEKEKNERLKERLADLKECQINENVQEEVMLELSNKFFEQTRLIKEWESELEKGLNQVKQLLEDKIQQKESAQKRIQDVLEYLKNQKNELQKELIK